MHAHDTRIRLGAIALAVAGLLFLLYPAVRPWTDESTTEGATRAMASGAWVASHLFAMLGFVLVALAALAVWGAVSRTRAEPLAGAAVVAVWVGVGLTLPYYGGETFGLHAIAAAAAGQDFDLLEVVEGFRFHPVAITLFGLGLLMLALGAVLIALAIRRSGTTAPHAGLVFALGFVLFLPQFFTPAGVRIAHGVLVALGCLWLGGALWQAAATASGSPPPARRAPTGTGRRDPGAGSSRSRPRRV